MEVKLWFTYPFLEKLKKFNYVLSCKGYINNLLNKFDINKAVNKAWHDNYFSGHKYFHKSPHLVLIEILKLFNYLDVTALQYKLKINNNFCA